MKTIKYLVPFWVLTFISFWAIAQNNERFNLNSDNGLPSNHVYATSVDRYGYLWIPTEKGLVKYNGYDFRVFNENDGLPSQDIWRAFEDAGGRIWLGSINNELGYLYKDKYHTAYTNPSNRSIYLRQLNRNEQGVIFFSQYLTDTFLPSIAISNGKEFQFFSLPKNLFDGFTGKLVDKPPIVYITNKNDIKVLFDHCLFKGGIVDGKLLLHKTLDSVDDYFFDRRVEIGGLIYKNYIINYEIVFKTTIFKAFNVNNGTVRTIDLKPWLGADSINIMDYNATDTNNIYIYGKTKVLKLKLGASIAEDSIMELNVASLTDEKQINLTGLVSDHLWGEMLSTERKGLYLQFNDQNKFEKNNLNLTNYKCIGGEPDIATFWWNENEHKLIKLSATMKKIAEYPKINEGVNLVARIAPDSFLLCTDRKSKLWYLLTGINKIQKYKQLFNGSLLKLSAFSSNMLLILDKQFIGTMDISNIKNTGTKNIDIDRYLDFLLDKPLNCYVAYNKNKILTFDQNGKKIIGKETLSKYGITKINKVVCNDSFSDIFIQTPFNLYEYDLKSNIGHEILQGLNIENASITVHKNRLIVTSTGGVTFVKINGNNNLSTPIIRKNLKNSNYKKIFDVIASSNKVLLNTDGGTYTIDIPSDSEFNQQVAYQSPYNFLIYYRDSVVSSKLGDTITLDQNLLKLRLDVINPSGMGKLKFRYKIGQETGIITNSELALPAFVKPGLYYTVSITAYDDVWKSSERTIVIYITPTWWQKLLLGRFFKLELTLVILIFAATIVLITRLILNRANQKRNLIRDIELKSVYSQINPHFIFNTLNTALVFIRKNRNDEAFQLVLKFSHLLRAYIASSRKKYISIADETTNLDNYIKLQQVRFGDKFDFDIVTEEGINTEKTKIPAMLLQPVVENAIDHGLFHLERKGTLKIEFKKIPLSAGIQCVVTDNGVGREQAKLLSQASLIKKDSYGNELLKDLVNIFNKYEHMGITVEYIDKKEPETGTSVVISIKKPLYEK